MIKAQRKEGVKNLKNRKQHLWIAPSEENIQKASTFLVFEKNFCILSRPEYVQYIQLSLHFFFIFRVLIESTKNFFMMINKKPQRLKILLTIYIQKFRMHSYIPTYLILMHVILRFYRRMHKKCNDLNIHFTFLDFRPLITYVD